MSLFGTSEEAISFIFQSTLDVFTVILKGGPKKSNRSNFVFLIS
jgi:hypothetical protein